MWQTKRPSKTEKHNNAEKGPILKCQKWCETFHDILVEKFNFTE